MALDRVSEQYSALGNVAGSGVKRVLGKPPLDTLSVVIREAVQNSWDARIRDSSDQLRIQLRFRDLNRSQRDVLGECLRDLPLESEIGQGLSAMLSSTSAVRVMEIADYGTVGLSGPESPQFNPGQAEGTHFVDFIRNIGKEHSEVDGGTYGFGKSSFYALSEVSTIYVDSRTTDNSEPVQRLMFAALGNRFTAEVDGVDLNFTGRHWWGISNEPGNVSPVTGSSVDKAREHLGLPARGDNDTGTTVGVLLPGLSDSIDQPGFVDEIRRILLANFWTKMVPGPNGLPAIEFLLEINGTLFEIPDPRMFSPLSLYVAALEGARSQDASSSTVDEIVTGGNKVHLGYVGFMPARKSPRPDGLKSGLSETWSQSAGGFLFQDEPVHHYAVMRSGELVVRYFEGRPHPNPDIEWAGVFITSSVQEVERAFATSEPPAHDDWNPHGMTGEAGRYVRAGLREIRRAFDGFVTPNVPVAGSDVSLGLPAVKLGSLLPGMAAGDASGPATTRASGSGGRQSARQGRFNPAGFERYDTYAGQSVLVFSAEWLPGNSPSDIGVLRAEPKVLLEGKPVGLDEVPAGFAKPRVLEMSADSSSVRVLEADRAEYDTSVGFKILVKISHVSDLAVSMDVNRVKPE